MTNFQALWNKENLNNNNYTVAFGSIHICSIIKGYHFYGSTKSVNSEIAYFLYGQ